MSANPDSPVAQLDRVLFIRLGAIGDILLMTPLLRMFHAHYPQTQMDVLVKEKFFSLLQFHPLLHEVVLLPDSPSLPELVQTTKTLADKDYNVIFDLQKHWRSYFISWFAHADQVCRYTKFSGRRLALVYGKKNYYAGVPDTIPARYHLAFWQFQLPWQPAALELYLPDFEQESVAARWPFAPTDLVIAVAPGAGRETKKWPSIYYIELILKIRRQRDVQFLLLGGEGDIALCAEIERTLKGQVVNWCGTTTLLATAAALRRCQLVICNDTGLMHLAAAMQRRIVAIFGPTVREFGFFPFMTNATVVEHSHLACRPCSFHGTASCPKKHFRCMMELSPDRVLGEVEKMLRGLKIETSKDTV